MNIKETIEEQIEELIALGITSDKPHPEDFKAKMHLRTALTQLEKTVREEDVELLAEYFYHQILYDIDGKKPAWVIRGNSLKQQEARKKASKTLNPTK